MDEQNEAVSIPNARLLSAIYFGLLAIIGTVIIDTILYLLGLSEILPMFQSILLAVILAAILGALFAHKIMHCKEPYRFKTFCFGFLIVIIALPVYNLIVILLMIQKHTQVFATTNFIDYLSLYFIYLFFAFIMAGLWLGVASGLAAIYLRGRLVYDIQRSQDMRRKPSIEQKTKLNRSTMPHRKKH